VWKQEVERKKKIKSFSLGEKPTRNHLQLQLTVITQVWKSTIKLLIKKRYLTAKKNHSIEKRLQCSKSTAT
jgi:hypothetical protein